MSKKGEELGPPFEGWTRSQLISHLASEGVNIAKSTDKKTVTNYAKQYYAQANRPIPRPRSSSKDRKSQKRPGSVGGRSAKANPTRSSKPRQKRPGSVDQGSKASNPSRISNPRVPNQQRRASQSSAVKSKVDGRDDKRKSRRVSNVRKARNSVAESFESGASGYSNPAGKPRSSSRPRRASNMKGKGKPHQSSRTDSKTQNAKNQADQDDIIDFLLDQVDLDGRDTQSFYSRPSGFTSNPAQTTTVVTTAKPKAVTRQSPQMKVTQKVLDRPKTRRELKEYRAHERNKHRYSGGIDDFGEYDPELALEDAARFAFSTAKPDVNAAKDYAKRFHPIEYDGEKFFICGSTGGRLCFPDSYCCDVFDEGNESHFAKYGVGMSLYFKWLKWLFWIFFVLTLVASPQLFINAAGAGGKLDTSSIQSFLFVTSIGNLVDDSLTIVNAVENSTDIEFLPIGEAFPNATLELPGFNCNGGSCEIDRQTVHRMYVATDFLITLAILLGAVHLRFFTVIEYGLLEKYFRKIDQYTVEIKNLPEDTNEEEVLDFFNRHLPGKVHDVVLATDNGKMIELYQQRGKLVAQLWNIVGHAKQLVEDHEDRLKHLSILNIDAYNEKVRDMIETLNEKKAEVGAKYDWVFAQYLALGEMRKRIKLGERVVAGYVTFETSQDYENALESMKKKGACQPRRKRSLSNSPVEKIPPFANTKLLAKPAQPPSTIIWENLEYTDCSRFMRKTVTFVLALILLGFSFSIAFITQSFRVELTANSRNITLALECENLEQLPQSNNVFNFELVDEALQFGQMQDIILERNLQADPAALLQCRCSLLSFTDAALAIINRGNECHDFWSDLAPVYVFTSFSAMIIATVSVFMIVMTRTLASFEKHKSVQAKELSIGSRLYIALFINIGLALLLVNANFVADIGFIGKGKYDDFTAEWYANVGVQIFITMLINSFSPHSMGISAFMLQKLAQVFSQPKVQAQMNKLYLGGEFVPSYRYAQQLTAITVSLIYGAGFPLFYPLACLNFAVYYWVDKFLFLRFYQTPPDFGDSLAKLASRVMLLLVPIHAAFAVYMYTAPGLFLVRDEELANNATGLEFVNSAFGRFTLSESIPMTLLILVGFGIFLFDSLVVMNSKAYRHEKARYEEEDDNFEGVTKGKQKGEFDTLLTTYNLLENRKYLNDFGISPIFARENRGVEAVFMNDEKMNIPKLPDEIRFREEPDQDHAAFL